MNRIAPVSSLRAGDVEQLNLADISGGGSTADGILNQEQQQIMLMRMMQQGMQQGGGIQGGEQNASPPDSGRVAFNSVMPFNGVVPDISMPGGVHQRQNATTAAPHGEHHNHTLKAAAHAAGAAAMMTPAQAAHAATKAHDLAVANGDDEAAPKAGALAFLKKCTPANVKIWATMLKEGAVLRPALTAICVMQVLMFGALYGSGLYPDNDAALSISREDDLQVN
jgi:hypothetical protein